MRRGLVRNNYVFYPGLVMFILGLLITTADVEEVFGLAVPIAAVIGAPFAELSYGLVNIRFITGVILTLISIPLLKWGWQ